MTGRQSLKAFVTLIFNTQNTMSSLSMPMMRAIFPGKLPFRSILSWFSTPICLWTFDFARRLLRAVPDRMPTFCKPSVGQSPCLSNYCRIQIPVSFIGQEVQLWDLVQTLRTLCSRLDEVGQENCVAKFFSMQVPSAAKLVHAPVMDPESKVLRADGGEIPYKSFGFHKIQVSHPKTPSIKSTSQLVTPLCFLISVPLEHCWGLKEIDQRHIIHTF